MTDLHQPYRYTYAGADLFYNIRLKTITADLATASPGSVVWKIPALYGQVCLPEPCPLVKANHPSAVEKSQLIDHAHRPCQRCGGSVWSHRVLEANLTP